MRPTPADHDDWSFMPRMPGRILRDEVLHSLREAILQGEIPPGRHLNEVEIARSIGISRGPVREAIRQLDQEGLVDFLPRRGAIVAGLPKVEIGLTYELRRGIEEWAFTRACDVATDEQLETVEGRWHAIRDAMPRRDLDELIGLDMAFHLEVVSIACSPFYRRVWLSLHGVIRASTLRVNLAGEPIDEARFERSLREHEPLAAAVVGRDRTQAAALVNAHIMGASELSRGR